VAGAISAAPEQSRGHAMRLLCYAALFFLAMQLGRSSRHADMVLCGLAVAATAYAAYGLTVMLLGLDSILFYPKWAYHESLTATFVNRNHFATYAGLGLLATVGLLGRQWREASLEAGIHRDPQAAFADQFGARGWLLAGAATVQAFALLLSHSRAGFAATVLGFAALAALGWLGRRERPRPAEAAALVAAGLVVLAAVMLAALGGGEAALSDRAAIYRATLAGIAERPWAGHGAGSFPELVMRHVGGPLALGSELVERAHNTYLEVAFELGLPGFLLWLALPAAVVLRCLRGVGERHRNVLYPAVGVAATVLVGSHALFDFSLQIPAVAATYAMLMGLAYAQSYRTDGAPAHLPRSEPRGRSGPLLRRR
jgi:O-antigen ligase